MPKFSGLNQASPSPFKGPPACVKSATCGAVGLPRFCLLGFSFVHDSPGVPDKLKENLRSGFLIVQQGKSFTGPEIYTYTTACMQAPGVRWPFNAFLALGLLPPLSPASMEL